MQPVYAIFLLSLAIKTVKHYTIHATSLCNFFTQLAIKTIKSKLKTTYNIIINKGNINTVVFANLTIFLIQLSHESIVFPIISIIWAEASHWVLLKKKDAENTK